MIKKKPSEAFDMVLLHDPALLPAGDKALNEYSMDRDITKLDVDVDKGIYRPTGELVTVVRVLPLRSDSFHLLESGAIAFKQIVKTHVVRAVNLCGEPGIKVSITKDGTTDIADSDIEMIDFDTLSEIASVIVERGKGRDGVDRAFFSEAGSRVGRIRSRQLHANIARIENVKDMLSRIASEAEETVSTE